MFISFNIIADDIGKNVDLTGIEILEKDQRLIRQARSDIEKQATSMMEKGMEMQNQTQVKYIFIFYKSKKTNIVFIGWNCLTSVFQSRYFSTLC